MSVESLFINEYQSNMRCNCRKSVICGTAILYYHIGTLVSLRLVVSNDADIHAEKVTTSERQCLGKLITYHLNQPNGTGGVSI